MEQVQVKKSIDEVKKIVKNVKCVLFGVDFYFHVRKYKESMYLQVSFLAPGIDDMLKDVKTIETQWCRKWVLQSVMTPTEIVRTCYKAAFAAMQHEMEESFMYKNVRIYNPHRDIEELVKTNFLLDKRTE
jgi:hypothetical protein